MRTKEELMSLLTANRRAQLALHNEENRIVEDITAIQEEAKESKLPSNYHQEDLDKFDLENRFNALEALVFNNYNDLLERIKAIEKRLEHPNPNITWGYVDREPSKPSVAPTPDPQRDLIIKHLEAIIKTQPITP